MSRQMREHGSVRVLLVIAAVLTCASNVLADGARVDVRHRQDITNSRYEKLSGTVQFGDGASEGSSAFFVLQPKNGAERNGAVLIEVADESQRPMLRLFNRAGPNPDPESSADLGDGFLMKYGFTLAWVNSQAALQVFATWMKRSDGAVAAQHVYIIESPTPGPVLRQFATDGGGQFKAFRVSAGDGTVGRQTPPEDVRTRTFLFVGTAREPARFPPPRIDERQFENAVDYWWSMRALLLAFHRWVTADREPPRSGEVVLLEIAVPLGSYATSAWVPFSRAVIEERYGSRENYLAKSRDAADSLVRDGYLLYDDVDRVVQRADDVWYLAFESR